MQAGHQFRHPTRRPRRPARRRRRLPRRAAREGDFEALVAVLDPDVVLRIDLGALPAAARRPAVVRGAADVAEQMLKGARGARFARPAVVNGAAGLVIVPARRPVAVVGFAVADGRIVEIDVIADPEKLRAVAVDVR